MGEIGSGLAFLCCCGSDDPSSNGKTKPDPRERMIDDEFLARNYRQDSSGRFHTQPTPTSSMFPSSRQLSDQSYSRSGTNAKQGGGDVLETRKIEAGVAAGHLQPPQLGFRDSESTAVDSPGSVGVSVDSEEAKATAKADPQIQVSAES